MQPYFFPYAGYFQLMAHVDHWVIFDQVQFPDKGWVNRNRILHPTYEKGWQYITLPLSQRHRHSRICDLQIAEQLQWRENILGKLTLYAREAPYYNRTIEFIRECFAVTDLGLSDYLCRLLRMTADLLGIETPFISQHDLTLDHNLIRQPGDWALALAAKLKADEYVNLPGGYRLFNEQDFMANRIELRFIQPRLRSYNQMGGDFVSGLSIIDLLMWNSLDQIKQILTCDYTLLNYSGMAAMAESNTSA